MNKFLIVLVTAIALFFAYGIYEQMNQKSLKSKRVACQENTTTFEKVFKKDKIQEAKKLLKTQNIEIISRIDYSKYMKSQLINFYNKEKALLDLNSVLDKYMSEKQDLNKKLVIDLYIYENDKEDKGKKSDKAKLYAGYLVFEFKLEKELLYKIQIDYMKINAQDIKERMDCAIKSFISIN